MNPDGNKATLLELADTLLKSWWTVVAGICFGLAGALLALSYMPKIYEAATKIRIAPQSIPEDFVRSTVTDDMSVRLLEIEEAILSREYMDELIESNFDLTPDEETREKLRRILRSRVEVIHRRNTRLCSLVYRDTDARRAADVVNHLTRLYVEQNKEFRASEAQNTRATFEDLAAEAKKELDAIEQRLSQFNTLHRHETEAFLDANLSLLETRRRDLDSNQREQSATRLRLQELKAKREQGDWRVVSSEEGVVRDPRAHRIFTLRRELEDLRVHYSEDHPDVLKKQRELEEILATKPPATKDDGEAPKLPVDPDLAALESQITAVGRELNELKAGETRLRKEIATIERRIDRTPQVQAELGDLEEKRRILDERYRDLKGKAEEAKGAEFLEESERGQRLEVIEWAVMPFRPISPDPQRIYLMGVIVGALLFVGPVLLRSFLNPLVASEAGLRALTEVPVLVSIPRFMTQDTAWSGRRRLLKNVSISILSTAALAAVFVYLRT